MTIENLWKHINLEFLTFNFIFDENLLVKIKATPTMHLPNVWCQHHMQHLRSFFSCNLVALGYLVLHFPSDLVSWDSCYKKFPRQTEKLNRTKLVAQWWESVEKRMLEINVAHGVVVSSRKSECSGKACQDEKPCEEIIVSSSKRYICLT